MNTLLLSVPAIARGLASSQLRHGLQLRALSSLKAKTLSKDQLPLHTGRPRLVVLGSGWAAARLLHDIDPKLYDITVVSPRNHMVFTPLLASTTVGTLEPRSVVVHLFELQPALSAPANAIYIAEAQSVDPAARTVSCRSADGLAFTLPYDKLAICTGSQGSTFGIPGVQQHALFLRDVAQADAIRQRLIDNLSLAGIPGRRLEEWQRLLHVVIVGGGPTGVEVAGELTDFIHKELRNLYPDRARAMRITLVEARELLGTFDASLREYAARKLMRRGVALRKGVVQELTEREVVLKDGAVLPYGLCIWSTGVGPTPFILSLPFAKTNMGRLAVDGFMRVLAPPVSEGGQGGQQQQAGGQTLQEGQPPEGAMQQQQQRPQASGPGPETVPGIMSRGPGAPSPSSPSLAPVPEVYSL
ncbi:hypothetical protein Agub_g14566, partial [Astrephomene gubernaculifera]